MEQKQLDELDESYFGEEFIDDDSFETIKVEDIPSIDNLDAVEEVVIEKVETKPKKKATTKRAKTTKSAKAENKDMLNNDLKVEDKQEEVKIVQEEKVDPFTKKTKVDDKLDTKVETATPVNPWEEKSTKNDESRLFEITSTWKAITGIVVVLLIFSVFTQGFQFSEDTQITGAVVGEDMENSITLAQAEDRVLDYVNTNLLQPPYVAEVVSSEELDDVFKLTLSVADQEVDAFLTKDGRYFFPQGFDISFGLVVKEVDEEEVQLEEPEGTNEEVEVLPEEEEVEEEVVPIITESSQREFSLTAKKWLF